MKYGIKVAKHHIAYHFDQRVWLANYGKSNVDQTSEAKIKFEKHLFHNLMVIASQGTLI